MTHAAPMTDNRNTGDPSLAAHLALATAAGFGTGALIVQLALDLSQAPRAYWLFLTLWTAPLPLWLHAARDSWRAAATRRRRLADTLVNMAPPLALPPAAALAALQAPNPHPLPLAVALGVMTAVSAAHLVRPVLKGPEAKPQPGEPSPGEQQEPQ